MDEIPETPKSAKRITDERDRALYVISVAAELAGVHPQTLRMYERRGLISPARSDGGNRRYSERDLDHVRLIQSLTQEHGMSLTGVEMFVSMNRTLEEMEDRLERMREEMEDRVARAREEVERLRRSVRADLVPIRDAQPFYPRREET